MANFARGAEQAEAAASAASFAGRAQFFTVKSKERAFVRFLDDLDGWVTCGVHMGVPTKPAPAGYKGKWPTQMSAICQNDSAFLVLKDDGTPSDKYEPGYGECYIHSHMADVIGAFNQSVARVASTVWALCALREPVKVDGKVIGFKDKTEEWKDKDGKTHQVPAVRLVSQRWTNFFGPLKATTYLSGTVCGADYMVERKDNDYNIVALNETPDLNPQADAWQRYVSALELMNISLVGSIVEQSTPEYYARFFDKRVTAAASADASQQDVPPDDSAPAADTSEQVSDEEIEAMRRRLEKSVGAPAGPADSASA